MDGAVDSDADDDDGAGEAAGAGVDGVEDPVAVPGCPMTAVKPSRMTSVAAKTIPTSATWRAAAEVSNTGAA